MYIYIVIHRHTVSLYHNSSVWLDTLDVWSWDRNLPNFMLDLVLNTQPQATHGSSGIIRYYIIAFVCLHFALLDTRVLSSLEELCTTLVAAVNSFARVLNPQKGAYIVIHRQTISLYHNSSVWLDTLGAWTWDRNPMFVLKYCYLTVPLSSATDGFPFACIWALSSPYL